MSGNGKSVIWRGSEEEQAPQAAPADPGAPPSQAGRQGLHHRQADETGEAPPAQARQAEAAV